MAGETLFYVVIAIGLVTGFGTMGIDVSALIAGLGLSGFALGFALRDAVSNLIAGVLILLYRPFSYGDKHNDMVAIADGDQHQLPLPLHASGS